MTWQPPPERRDHSPVFVDVEAYKAGGQIILRAVRIWESLPRTWRKKTTNERQLWVEEYFQRALHLKDDDKLIRVTIRSDAA